MQYEPFHAELTVDPKGRVTLPVSLRMTLRMAGTNQLVAVANEGDQGGLSLFAQQTYSDFLTEKTVSIDPFASHSREMLFLRAIVATSHTLTIDGNGRILLPRHLRELASLHSRLLLFSVGRWLELWSSERWLERYPQLVQRWLTPPALSPAPAPTS